MSPRNKKSLFRNPLIIWTVLELFSLVESHLVIKNTIFKISLSVCNTFCWTYISRWSKEENGYRSDISISWGIQRVFSYWAPYGTNFILGHLLKSYEIFSQPCLVLSMRVWLKTSAIVQIFHLHLRWLIIRLGAAMDWMFASLQNSYIEVLTLNVTIFGDMDFLEVIKVKWVIRMKPWSNKINVLIRRDEGESLLSLSLSLPYEDTVRRQPSVGQEESSHQEPNWLAPWSSYPPELWENTFVLFKPPSLQYFIMAALAD